MREHGAQFGQAGIEEIGALDQAGRAAQVAPAQQVDGVALHGVHAHQMSSTVLRGRF